jgi:hypothetical protein
MPIDRIPEWFLRKFHMTGQTQSLSKTDLTFLYYVRSISMFTQDNQMIGKISRLSSTVSQSSDSGFV